MRKQGTLRGIVEVEGRGLHTGETVKVLLRPDEPDRGIRFVRMDLDKRVEVPLDERFLLRDERQTVLARDGAEVHTVEHLTASLVMLGIDNVIVEIDRPELPGLDGSAREYVRAIEAVGRQEQRAPRKTYALDEPVVVEHKGSVLMATPHPDALDLSYTLSYPAETGIAPQHVSFSLDEATFKEQIAPARTFCLEQEAMALKAAGFGKGADTSNTLVLRPDGPVDNELRFPDEPARHKILDLIGDLALLGCDLRARVVGTRSGHGTNHALVRALRARLRDLETSGQIQSDTGLDVREILKIIPHRYPFLFVDRVLELDGWQRAVGLKNVSINEPYFEGHWPGQPIMPGVLQVEALAQLSGVLLLRRLQNAGKVAVLLGIDHIKFRRPVVPGDQLRLECDTIFLKSRSGKVRGRGFVSDELTCEAVMKFMLMDA